MRRDDPKLSTVSTTLGREAPGSNLAPVARVRSSNLAPGIDDLDEVWLETGSAHQEPVDVWLGTEFGGCAGGDTASVNDSGVGRHLGGDVVLEPLAEVVVDFLGLGGGGGLAGTDGPNRFIGEDDPAPVGDVGLHRGQLGEHNLLGAAGFPLGQLLSEAGDHLEPFCERKADLLADELVGLAEDVASFGVAEDDPLAAEVLDHGGGDLPGEGALANLVAVLGRNSNIGRDDLPRVGKVALGTAHHDLCFSTERSLFEEIGNAINFGFIAVHFPVSTNEEFSVTHFD